MLRGSLNAFADSAPYCAEGADVQGRCRIQHQPVYLNSQFAMGWENTKKYGVPPLAPYSRTFERIPPYRDPFQRQSWGCSGSLLCQMGLK